MGAFLLGLFASLGAGIANLIEKKAVLVLFIIPAIATVTLAVLAAIYALIASITPIAPAGMTQALSMITPSNFWPCVSVIITAKIIRWVWIWKVHFVELFSN